MRMSLFLFFLILHENRFQSFDGHERDGHDEGIPGLLGIIQHVIIQIRMHQGIPGLHLDRKVEQLQIEIGGMDDFRIHIRVHGICQCHVVDIDSRKACQRAEPSRRRTCNQLGCHHGLGRICPGRKQPYENTEYGAAEGA